MRSEKWDDIQACSDSGGATIGKAQGNNMKLSGKLIKGTTTLAEKTFEIDDAEGTYQDRLEKSLVGLCSLLAIEVPMWLTKNTREYARFRRTSFNADQFFNPVVFDRFEIKSE